MDNISQTITAAEKGQEPIGLPSMLWLFLLTILWSFNSIAIKIAVLDVPPFWAAFLRFAPAAIIVGVFLVVRKTGLSVTLKEFFLISLVGVLMGLQIFTFNLGSMSTTGGRVTLFIFSYPFYVALLAPLFVKEERLSLRMVLGALIALGGLVVALSSRLSGGNFSGDVIEALSGIILAFQVSVNKMVIRVVDKWKITFWQFVVASLVFLVGALIFERFDPARIHPASLLAIVFQIVVISVFGILAWQMLLAKHSAAKVSIFFFVTPIVGTIIGMIFLKEAFDPGLVAGSVLVGSGIAVVYWKRGA